MPHLEVTVNGATGTPMLRAFDLDIPGNVTGQTMELTAATQRSTLMVLRHHRLNLTGSDNSLSAPGNVKEASAYRSVNLIHDHMRQWLPNFIDLDFCMPVNIDVAGMQRLLRRSQCEFHDLVAGCNLTHSLSMSSITSTATPSTIGTIQMGSFFLNGAMNEGYADLWAMSFANIAEIGKGFYVDNNDESGGMTRTPKSTPRTLWVKCMRMEKFCGAWYDTHLSMGGDWDQT